MLGWLSSVLGNWEKALEEARAALRLDPSLAGWYVNLGQAYTFLNRVTGYPLDSADHNL
jgi:tetratricopeptide (TPR) repeat protein